MLINLLLIIIGFGVLIFIHELGHFLAARWAGIRTEAFAIGMGPVVLAWRKGIGVRLRSTAQEYSRRVHDHLQRQRGEQSQVKEKVEAIGELPRAQLCRIGDTLGLGETEYSLRWLPIGGFVKMLGQDDADPSYVSDDPRSYNRCPVGKRMIVISAGVVANAILAVILFIIAFMAGVRFPAAVIGDVGESMPAGTTKAENADALGVSSVGLEPGDRVLSIDDQPVEQFADVQIAAAMSRPGGAIQLSVQREGIAQPLRFMLSPQLAPESGLLSIGVAPGASNQLLTDDEYGSLSRVLTKSGLAAAGVKPGMRLVRANGQTITTFQQVQKMVDRGDGRPIQTQWTAVDAHGSETGLPIQCELAVRPQYQLLRYAEIPEGAVQDFELGLLGLTPAVRIDEIPKDSVNLGLLRENDVILQVGSQHVPRLAEFRREIGRRPPGPVELTVLRDGAETAFTAQVARRGLLKRDGVLNVLPAWADQTPIVAAPMDQIRTAPKSPAPGAAGAAAGTPLLGTVIDTPAAALRLLPGTRLDAVNDQPISNWPQFRAALRSATAAAAAAHQDATVRLAVTHPTPGHERQTIDWALSADDIAALHDLGWTTDLSSAAFEPIHVVRSAGGNPVRAVTMGLQETHKLIVLTYLTIDRLFRGSVGVEQLRGPVGIVQMGARVADLGMTYLLFFMAMISINLAVINFLPLPIVDGGQFLFLIYEKFRGRPPSIAFQNFATIIGLVLIGSIFLITFYYDIARLIG